MYLSLTSPRGGVGLIIGDLNRLVFQSPCIPSHVGYYFLAKSPALWGWHISWGLESNKSKAFHLSHHRGTSQLQSAQFPHLQPGDPPPPPRPLGKTMTRVLGPTYATESDMSFYCITKVTVPLTVGREPTLA